MSGTKPDLISDYEATKNQPVTEVGPGGPLTPPAAPGAVPPDLSADYDKRAKLPDYGVMNDFVHGVTFGWNEKADVAARTLIDKMQGDETPFKELYQRNLDAQLQAREQHRNAHPVASKVATGAGMVAPWLFFPEAMGVDAAAGLGARALAGAQAGAVTAGLTAAAEAKPGEELQQGARAIIPGAAFGGFGGAVIPPAVTGIFNRLPGGRNRAALGALSKFPGFSEGELGGMMQRIQTQMARGEPITLAQLGRPEQVEALFAEIAKQSPNARRSLTNFIEQQQAAAEPLYTQAFSQNISRSSNPNIAQALNHPEIANAIETARERLVAEGIPVPAGPNPAVLQMAQQLQARNPALLNLPSNSVFRQALQDADQMPVVLIDRAKQILDRTIWRRPRSTDEYKVAAATRDALTQLIDATDQAVPAYGQARATAATYKQLGDAIRTGRAAQAAEAMGETKGGTAIMNASEMASASLGMRAYAIPHAILRNAVSAVKPTVLNRAAPEVADALLTGAGGPNGGPQDLMRLIMQIEQRHGARSAMPAGVGGVGGDLIGSLMNGR